MCAGLDKIENYSSFKNLIINKNTENWISTTWLEVCGTKYQNGIIVTLKKTESALHFGKIEHSLVNENEEAFFMYKEINILSFVEHMQAFEVVETNNWGFITQK